MDLLFQYYNNFEREGVEKSFANKLIMRFLTLSFQAHIIGVISNMIPSEKRNLAISTEI